MFIEYAQNNAHCEDKTSINYNHNPLLTAFLIFAIIIGATPNRMQTIRKKGSKRCNLTGASGVRYNEAASTLNRKDADDYG